MAASMLIVTGGDAFARAVYEDEGRVDWAQALPLVLEKLGFLDFDVAAPEVLEDERTWRMPSVLLVARLPTTAWSERAAALAVGGRRRAFIELPPPILHGALGIHTAEPADRQGTFSPLGELRGATEAATTFITTRLELPESRPVPREADLDWSVLDVPISAAQAERWRAPGWDVQRWSVDPTTEVLGEWSVGKEKARARWPALVARGRLAATCFSMLGYLGQQTTVQPHSGPESLNWPRSTGIEVALAHIIDRLHQEAGVSRVRVLPWPAGSRWVLSTRHDYDRELTPDQAESIVARHHQAGSAATWYWRARFLDGRDGERSRLARRIDHAPGQEVAHHTEQLWRGADSEQRKIERALRRPVAGSCAHGDPGCFRWQGAPNVLWAERQGLMYTEFISHAHQHPHRFAALADDGTVTFSRVICLPHHLSLDRSMTPGDAATDAVVASAEEYVRGGGMLQILSHPDINVDALFEAIGRLPSEGRLDLTARDAAAWWARSHVREELTLVRHSDGTITVSSPRGVRGLVLEVLRADGMRRRRVVDVDPGGSIVLGADDGDADPARRRARVWKQKASPVFAEAVRAYYAAQGIDASSAEVRTTIATNTDLVPSRVETIFSYLRDLQGLDSLRGARILDIGGGFAAFAVYLALDPDVPLVTTVDVRADFVASGREVATRLGLENLDPRLADMRSLSDFGDAQFDLVILNNSFLYLTTKDDMRRALGEIARLLRPNGRVILFHANRWRLREPFTRAPIVHLLPPRLADRVSRLTGWRHSHGRVLLVSVPWLSRELRRAGLVDVRSGGAHNPRLLPGGWLSGFYAVTGRKPPV